MLILYYHFLLLGASSNRSGRNFSKNTDVKFAFVFFLIFISKQNINYFYDSLKICKTQTRHNKTQTRHNKTHIRHNKTHFIFLCVLLIFPVFMRGSRTLQDTLQKKCVLLKNGLFMRFFRNYKTQDTFFLLYLYFLLYIILLYIR